MRLRLLVPLLASLLFGSAAAAQNPSGDRWQIGLESGAYIWDVRLVKLTGDSLLFRQADTVGVTRVNQITEIRLIRKSTMRLGEGAGGGAMSALVGADDEVYDFQPLDFAARLRAIQQILLAHPPSQ